MSTVRRRICSSPMISPFIDWRYLSKTGLINLKTQVRNKTKKKSGGAGV